MTYIDIDCYERGCACASSSRFAGEALQVVEVVKVKPLSDEEILDIWYKHNNGSSNWTEFVKFARAIEERHGIK